MGIERNAKNLGATAKRGKLITKHLWSRDLTCVWLFLRGCRGMQEIMTCEICGCSFVDVESEDYTEVFTTGLCCECILEELR